MTTLRTTYVAAVSAVLCAAAHGQDYSWRYYRPGNTGIGGDWNESIWIGPDGDPWIGGYHPAWEEGGIAKFVQAENRWINISNVDYPVFGHPNEVGSSRVVDMIADGQGRFWVGTGNGVLRFDPTIGPSSLVKFGPGNSTIPGGWTQDITRAPDGSLWFSAYSTAWAGGGLSRYQPATNAWSFFADRGGKLAAQPKPGGGFYLWTSLGETYGIDRWDSTTQAWTHFPYAIGNPVALFSKDSVDDAGNMWILRLANEQGEWTLDCKRPDGSWVTPPLPPLYTGSAAPYSIIKPFGNMQAMLIVIAPDVTYHLHRFNGTSWTDLGVVIHNGFIDDLDVDAAGNIWVCGTGQGGAQRRDAATGAWQRYRITNTSQFDLFNNDLAIDPQTGDVYACANAGTGIGGMVKFDGVRWTCWDEHTYGLGFDWPFLTDNSRALTVRASNGSVVVSPADWIYGVHEWTASSFLRLPGLDGTTRLLEDSVGRVWASGGTIALGYFNGATWTIVPGGGYDAQLLKDPVLPGTVWCANFLEILRTDGVNRYTRTLDDFTPIIPAAVGLGAIAVEGNGHVWVGLGTSEGSALAHLNPETGDVSVVPHDETWPFPWKYLSPLAATPDGRLWMIYEAGDYPIEGRGLCWYDGVNFGDFPAPFNGEPQWGGLPHAGIKDIEVKLIAGGYELWMSCLSRGIAVLTVTYPPALAGDLNCDGAVDFNDINPFVLALSDPAGYQFAYPSCDILSGDCNGDGWISFDDINPFVALLSAGG